MEFAYTEKITKILQFQKYFDPNHVVVHTIYYYYWIRIFSFLQIASVSQLQHVCGPNIHHMCKYFGTISNIVENIEV